MARSYTTAVVAVASSAVRGVNASAMLDGPGPLENTSQPTDASSETSQTLPASSIRFNSRFTSLGRSPRHDGNDSVEIISAI